MYVNVGATTQEGMPILTKKALRSFVASGDVRFYNTSAFGDEIGWTVRPSPGIKLSVVGPNPYTDRRWYATVELNAKGQVVVS